MRILHLEDSVADHRLTRDALARAGYAVEILRVDRLADYVNALTNQKFDIVLADFHLAGFTALDAWNATPQQFSGPFILLSGAIGETAAVQAIQDGVADYLHKDELHKLQRVIQRAIEVQRIANERLVMEQELKESQRRLSQFANHLQEKIEIERAAIAREIHDDIGGSLAAVKLDLAWIGRHSLEETTQKHIETANAMLQHALGASQRIMRNLRPAILDQGLVPAAKWLVESFEKRTGIKTVVNTIHCKMPHAKDVQLAAYRTVQEALTNASKYAHCSELKLDISDLDGVLTVEISDNGQGFSVEERSKNGVFGLRGLEERARSVGGWLDVISTTSTGSAIILTIPLTEEVDVSSGEPS